LANQNKKKKTDGGDEKGSLLPGEPLARGREKGTRGKVHRRQGNDGNEKRLSKRTKAEEISGGKRYWNEDNCRPTLEKLVIGRNSYL